MTRSLLLTIILNLSAAAAAVAAEPDAGELFERRIMPIFRSPNPSSCTECHLAGVELKNYILPSSELTFRSLRDQGLINVDHPDDSKILKLIRMRDPQAAGGKLIHEEVRKIEEAAFVAWLRACVSDKKLVNSPRLSKEERAAPPRPPEVIRHSRRDRLLDSFENTIWALRFRCMSCHTEGSKDNARLSREHGEQVTWIKSAGAAATMDYLIGSSLIDLERPAESLLLLKPLGRVEHVGGKKFLVGDQGYQAFRTWIEDYAKAVQDGYFDAASLPPREMVQRTGSELWVKLTNTPQAWGDALVRIDIHVWDPVIRNWRDRPSATSDRQNAPKLRQWQHTLTLLDDAVDGARQEQKQLLDGRYQVRVYVDRRIMTDDDWKRSSKLQEFAGAAEFSAKWLRGYSRMTVVDAQQLQSSNERPK